MHFPLLNELIVILALSSVVLLLCHRIGLPTIVGFLVTGVLAGPHGFGLIKAIREVEFLAEIGIVLLLFTIGLELSLKTLLESRRMVLLGGSLQVVLAILATFLLVRFKAVRPEQALFVGFLISLSSTAIVLKLLQDRGEIDSPIGRISVGILIFQDIVAIPMMLLTPVLAGVQSGNMPHPLRFFGMILGFLALLVLGSRYLVPFALSQVASTRNRELFLVSIVAVCFVVAWMTSELGLSLALGAFLAGLIVSESEYGHTAVSLVIPFRDLFSSFFFVSVGMLLDLRYVLANPLLIASLTFLVLAMKTGVAMAVAQILGYPMRIALGVGLCLSQVGEFPFVLARGGLEHGLLEAQSYALFLAVSVMTMALTPLLMAAAPRLTAAAERLPMPEVVRRGLASRVLTEQPPALSNHVVIIGFGFNGQSLARAAAACQLPYVILETQPDLIRAGRARGEPIYFGDATQHQVLRHLHVERARVVVLAISDIAATRLTLANLREISPGVRVIVRTRYIHELDALYARGATEVIPEEFETAVEIFTRVLNEYLVPRQRIEHLVGQLREGGYRMLRSLSLPLDEPVLPPADEPGLRVEIPNVDVTTVRVEPGAEAEGRDLATLALRTRFGVTLICLRRSDQLLTNPAPTLPFCAGDQVTLVGTPDQLVNAIAVFVREEAPSSHQAARDAAM